MKASAVHRVLSAIADLREGDAAMPEAVSSDAKTLEDCLHKYLKGGYDEPTEGDESAKKAAGREDDEEAPSFESAGEKTRARFQKSKKDSEKPSDEDY